MKRNNTKRQVENSIGLNKKDKEILLELDVPERMINMLMRNNKKYFPKETKRFNNFMKSKAVLRAFL